jgi:hypothetical protein
MRTTRLLFGCVPMLCAIAGSAFSLTGCTDPSKQSGTQVQVSDEAKARIEGRRQMYKERAQALREKSKTKKSR